MITITGLHVGMPAGPVLSVDTGFRAKLCLDNDLWSLRMASGLGVRGMGSDSAVKGWCLDAGYVRGKQAGAGHVEWCLYWQSLPVGCCRVSCLGHRCGSHMLQ